MARTFAERLGARLRAARRALGLSQPALAEAVSLSTNYIGLIERGAKLPALEVVVELAKAVGTTPGILIDDATPGDDWIDEVITVARTVPKPLRSVALGVLRAVAEGHPRR